MRISTLAVTVSAVAVLSWSGIGPAIAAPPQCSDLGGVVDPAKTCQIKATDPQYSLSISYPVNYPDTQPVFDYVKQTRDGFLNVAKTPDSRDMPYELETKATEYSSVKTRSVVFETYQGVGGAHPTTFYKSFTWDQGLRKAITIDTLFRAGTQPFSIILPIVEADLTKLSGQPVTIPPDVGLDPARYQNFAITDDSLIFFFSQGDLVAGAFGAQQVTVPRGPIDAMIA